MRWFSINVAMLPFNRYGPLIAYLVFVHVCLGLVLWKSDFLSRLERKLGGTQRTEITGHYASMLQYHMRMDGNVPDKAVVFVGDSLVQGLYTDAVASPSVNFGIGGDTTIGVLGRLPAYGSLLRASTVVLAIGVNDLKFRDNGEIIQNFRRILQSLPPTLPLVCSGILPVVETNQPPGRTTNERVREINVALEALCTEHKRCVFVDIGSKLFDTRGNILMTFYEADGVHLNSAGNGIWIEELRVAVRKIRQDNPPDVSIAPVTFLDMAPDTSIVG
jgi:lysophospholipase L1-like esterase